MGAQPLLHLTLRPVGAFPTTQAPSVRSRGALLSAESRSGGGEQPARLEGPAEFKAEQQQVPSQAPPRPPGCTRPWDRAGKGTGVFARPAGSRSSTHLSTPLPARGLELGGPIAIQLGPRSDHGAHQRCQLSRVGTGGCRALGCELWQCPVGQQRG